EARTTLQRLFPEREVIGIDSADLVWGLGAFHCVTQQWPLAAGQRDTRTAAHKEEGSGEL
ncbi:MAG TPA: agmatine deiminase family protein, partial [Gemmatimonadales bacterium]|nr:agmatine deiminase family protein [Gemmatimonadales bacterium]